jgi:hypothetical protein
MWYAGIDWADTHHDVVVIDEMGQRVGTLRVAHSPDGMAKLTTFLLNIPTAPVPTAANEQIVCIVEINHGLLITALLEAGLVVFPVNPKSTARC